ncbi:MAG: UBP-type zinc finger domain-containing protein [Coriobacteriia bacterium]
MPECEHMRSVPVPEPDAPTQGCEECLAIAQSWVHLRKCLDCGHVGCCDSSIGKHATKHAKETGHTCMRSFEPGEDWRWCYLDETMG